MALRDSIVEAALSVAAERGLDGASYELISARAGVSKGAVQHHFPAKGALALALAERVTHELRETARSAVAPGAGAALDWRSALSALSAAMRATDAGRALASLRVGARSDTALDAALARARDEAERALAEWITAEALARNLRVRLDARALAVLVLAGVETGDARAVEALAGLLPAAFSV